MSHPPGSAFPSINPIAQQDSNKYIMMPLLESVPGPKDSSAHCWRCLCVASQLPSVLVGSLSHPSLISALLSPLWSPSIPTWVEPQLHLLPSCALQLCWLTVCIQGQAHPRTNDMEEMIKTSKITPSTSHQSQRTAGMCSGSCRGCGDREPSTALGSGSGSLSWQLGIDWKPFTHVRGISRGLVPLKTFPFSSLSESQDSTRFWGTVPQVQQVGVR